MVTPEDEKALDDLLEDVHGKINVHIEKVKRRRKAKPATRKLDRAKHKKTQMAFQAMCEDEECEPFSMEDSREISKAETERLLKQVNNAKEKDAKPSWFERLTGRIKPA